MNSAITEITLTLRPIEPPKTPNYSEHYAVRAKRRRSERSLVESAMVIAGVQCLSRPPTKVLFVVRRHRLLDSDNAQGALKAYRDAVAEWFGVSDGPTGPIMWEYQQASASRKQEQIVQIILTFTGSTTVVDERNINGDDGDN